MNVLITICARGGSKGIPGKNIKELNGKPLIEYTINHAQAFGKKYGADLILSSDSDQIRSVAKEYGVYADYERPEILATDSAGKMAAINDALIHQEERLHKKYDYILDLDVTSPLRTMEDLETAFLQLQEKEDALNIFSVNEANRNPYFNMVERTEEGFAQVVKSVGDIKSRQSAPAVYDMNASFYFYRRKFFTEEWPVSTTPRSLAFVMDHVCFDIDHPIDFKIMEVVLREKLLGFQL